MAATDLSFSHFSCFVSASGGGHDIFLVLFTAFGILLLEMFIVDLYKTCSKIIDMHRLAKVPLPC